MSWTYHPGLEYYSWSLGDINIKPKQTIALFNFYGTLAWGDKGELVCFNSNSLIYSSPLIDIFLESFTNKGYTVCILETFKTKHSMEMGKKCISDFLTRNNLNYPVLITYTENLHKDIYNVGKILYDFFKPDYKFGKKSFYCGDEIDLYDTNPWYRISNLDTKIAKSLGFKLYNPEDLFGFLLNPILYYCINDLTITCGQTYSGFDIYYESIETDVIHLNMECKLQFFGRKRIYFIYSNILLDTLKDDEKITIYKNISYVIVGSNPTLKEREKLAEKFVYESGESVPSIIAWYTRPPYQWSYTFQKFLKIFETPYYTGEKWLRLN